MPAGYRIALVHERDLGAALRRAVGTLLAGILDDGPLYRESAWRTIQPVFRALAFHGDGVAVGHAAGFAVGSDPDVGLYGLGDVAVAPAHRRRGVARALCRLVTEQARRRGAGVVLAKTRPLRGVLADLGYVPVTGFEFFYEVDGACVRHPDWMAVTWRAHPTPVRLEEGDF